MSALQTLIDNGLAENASLRSTAEKYVAENIRLVKRVNELERLAKFRHDLCKEKQEVIERLLNEGGKAASRIDALHKAVAELETKLDEKVCEAWNLSEKLMAAEANSLTRISGYTDGVWTPGTDELKAQIKRLNDIIATTPPPCPIRENERLAAENTMLKNCNDQLDRTLKNLKAELNHVANKI